MKMIPTNLRFNPVFLIGLFMSGILLSQPAALKDLSPLAQAQYDPAIPTPFEVLGHSIGQTHTRTDQVIQYFQALDGAGNRVIMDTTGFTHERRALIHAIVTAPENMDNLDAIRERNLRLTWSPADLSPKDLADMPVIVYLAYSVHGDEASGTEAAILLLYHLAADQSPETRALLQRMVIIIDPMLNPDGRDRFVNWVNAYRSSGDRGDIRDMEHNQPWPGGRTNHFLHDLNRDWLLAQHPETRGRLKLYHSWQPQLLIDIHEMGRDATYFFQPGVPSRNNPNSPEEVFSLSRKLSRYFAKNLDNTGGLYFTGERFDDFYYGKGSTYPDINGAVGILFEQASSRALVSESDFGLLTYEKTIQQQLLTSLGALEGAYTLRNDLLLHQQTFYRSASEFARSQPVNAWLIDTKKHPQRVQYFLETLQSHQINAYRLANPLTYRKHAFRPENTLVLPLDQPQGRLLNAVMETVTEFKDSLFYDVSTWTFPAAFGITALPVTRSVSRYLGDPVTTLTVTGEEPESKAQYAYIMSWDRFTAPAALYQILEAGRHPLVALKPFTITLADGSRRAFQRGSIIIPVRDRDASGGPVHELVTNLSREYSVNFSAVNTGFSETGPALGSPNMRVLEKPVVALLAGEGTRSYAVGEIWHLLNQKMNMPVALLPVSRLTTGNLATYNTLIMPQGDYADLDSSAVQRIKQWVQNGGTLIALENSIKKLLTLHLIDEEIIPVPKDTVPVPYAKADNRRGAQYIGGTICIADVDTTHPLAFGLSDTQLLFRKSRIFLKPSKNQTANVLRYREEPVYSGYISSANKELLSGSGALLARTKGKGHIIFMTDSPFFRSFWYGSAPLLMNGIFLGGIY